VHQIAKTIPCLSTCRKEKKKKEEEEEEERRALTWM
jgi:hypothetical protein